MDTGTKVCSTSGYRSKFPYSYVTYFLLPYFRVEKVWEPSGDRPSQGKIFLRMSQRPQRYFRLVIMVKISWFICHIFPVAIFQKTKTFANYGKSASQLLQDIARQHLQDHPPAPKESSNSDNRTKYSYSGVTYYLFPYFRKRYSWTGIRRYTFLLKNFC